MPPARRWLSVLCNKFPSILIALVLHIQPIIAQKKGTRMILQKLTSNKNSKKFFMSIAAIFAIALFVVGRATFGGVVSEYNMPYSEWTTSMFFLQGAMVTVYSIVFTLLFSIPLGFLFGLRPPGLIVCDKANRSSPCDVLRFIASLCRRDDDDGARGDSLCRRYIPIIACKARALTATRSIFHFSLLQLNLSANGDKRKRLMK